MANFVLLIFPSTFLIVSMIVSKFVIATGERLEARLAQANQKHKEFGQIVEVLKSSESDGEVRLDLDLQRIGHPLLLLLVSPRVMLAIF